MDTRKPGEDERQCNRAGRRGDPPDQAEPAAELRKGRRQQKHAGANHVAHDQRDNGRQTKLASHGAIGASYGSSCDVPRVLTSVDNELHPCMPMRRFQILSRECAPDLRDGRVHDSRESWTGVPGCLPGDR